MRVDVCSALAQHTVAASEVPKTVVEAVRRLQQECGTLCARGVRRPGEVGQRRNLDRAGDGYRRAARAIVADPAVEARPRGGARGAVVATWADLAGGGAKGLGEGARGAGRARWGTEGGTE